MQQLERLFGATLSERPEYPRPALQRTSKIILPDRDPAGRACSPRHHENPVVAKKMTANCDIAQQIKSEL
jgi:hypothetical protein